LHGKGTVSWAGETANEPSYSVDAGLNGVAAPALGRLFDQHWTGGPVSVNGRVQLSGFKRTALASSAKGTLHFTWKHGSIGAGLQNAGPAPARSTLTMRFDEWTGEVEIADGAGKFGKNEVVSGGRKEVLHGAVTLTRLPRLQLTAGRPPTH